MRLETSTERLFLASVFATDFSRGGARVALSWALLRQYDTSGLGLIVLLMSLGQFTGAFIAGHLTDRFRRKKVAVIANWTGSVAFFAIAAAVAREGVPVAVIAALTFSTYLALAVHDNAARTLIPEIVPPADIRRVNGHFVTLGEIGYFLAPLASGWLIETSGSAWALYMAACSCMVGSLLVGMVHVKGRSGFESPVGSGPEQSLSIDLFLRNRWLLLGLIAATSANLFILPISTLLIPLRINEIGVGASELGYFYAALSLGLAVAGLVKLPRVTSIEEPLQLAISVSAAALVYLSTYLFDFFPVLLACGLCAGFMLAVFEINWNAAMQERAPANLMGRLYGVSSWLSFAGRAAGVAVAGLAVGAVGVQGVISTFIAGLLVTLGVAVFVCSNPNSKPSRHPPRP